MIETLAQIASCLDGYDPDALPVPQAKDFIARLVRPLVDVETVALPNALGRVLASDVVCPFDVPAHDNSAMDGYSLRGSDLATSGLPTRLALAGGALAGHRFDGTPPPGHCVRIMTGAVMPEGHDTVVPQELAQSRDGAVDIAAGAVRPGDNRRRRGEDLGAGETALTAGRRLRPADIGLLASLGQAQVTVRRRPRVAYFSTGDELRPVGEALPPGCVYDSNRYTIAAMLQRLGVEAVDLGVVRDDPLALEATLREAALCDAVVTSGGVSVGDADHTRATVAKVGEVLFWKIAMRPGRPMAIGRLQGGALLFGLPGNPVAVMVTFYALVRDALLQLSGAVPETLPMLRATASAPIRKRTGRTEYQRGIVTPAANGGWQVAVTGEQGSGILRSMSLANGLIVLAQDRGPVEAGEWVDVLPFDGLV